MEPIALSAQSRSVIGKKTKGLRKQNVLPAVLYGAKVKTQPIQVETVQFEKTLHQAGESSLIDLSVDDNNPLKVLIHDIARDPMSGSILHVDFHQVDMTKKITTHIALKFIGEAPAVKEAGGVFVANMDEIEVECLPKDLVHEIEVDVSSMKTFDDVMSVAQLTIPENITVKEKEDDVIALVKPPRSEKELEELDQEVTEDVEDVDKVEKEEGEEGEEDESKEAGEEKGEDIGEKKEESDDTKPEK